jgi:hypothetical protein
LNYLWKRLAIEAVIDMEVGFSTNDVGVRDWTRNTSSVVVLLEHAG